MVGIFLFVRVYFYVYKKMSIYFTIVGKHRPMGSFRRAILKMAAPFCLQAETELSKRELALLFLQYI